MKNKPRTIDEYLARVPDDDKRAALEKLRKTIQAAAPKAEECIAWELPSFRLEKFLVAFGAAKNHVSLYPMSGAIIKEFAAELKDFETSKGTIRFHPDKPIPATLVKKIVKARIKENAARAKRRA
jgi:uncharacterized protein YdhG (YjbR/CyaY superfamily)